MLVNNSGVDKKLVLQVKKVWVDMHSEKREERDDVVEVSSNLKANTPMKRPKFLYFGSHKDSTSKGRQSTREGYRQARNGHIAKKKLQQD